METRLSYFAAKGLNPWLPEKIVSPPKRLEHHRIAFCSPFSGLGFSAAGRFNVWRRSGGLLIIAAILILLLPPPARAQDAVSTPAVTADEVNAVARQMYCPVCENIPLDVCPTAACAQWRDEIKAQLAAGQSEAQIIAAFVARYGDRVVGTPQDPTLRALSLVTPWLIALVVVGVAGLLLRRWRRGRAPSATFAPASSGDGSRSDEDYRARLERDLQARR